METVVFLHGYTEDVSMWSSLHGHERNDQEFYFEDVNSYFVASTDLAKVASAIYIKYEKKSNIKFFGHSMGGYIACELMAMRKENIRAISLVNSTPFADSDEKKTNRDHGVKFIQEHGKKKYLHALIPKLYIANTPREVLESHIMKAEKIKDQVLINQLQAMRDRCDLTVELKSTKIPKQFVLGKNDPLIDFRILIKNFEDCTNFYLNLDNVSGHMPYRENPTFFKDAISEFLVT